MTKTERDAIRAQWKSQGEGLVGWPIPALLDDLDAKDRLLAEREATIAAMRKKLIDSSCNCGGSNRWPHGPGDTDCNRCSALQPDAGATLLKELRTLRIDNDRLEGLAEAQDKAIGSLTANREKLLADHAEQLAAYRKALEPFAAHEETLDKRTRSEIVFAAGSRRAEFWCETTPVEITQHCILYGDIRRAAAILQSPDSGKVLLDAHAAELEEVRGNLTMALAHIDAQGAERDAMRQELAKVTTMLTNERRSEWVRGELAALRQRAEAAEADIEEWRKRAESAERALAGGGE